MRKPYLQDIDFAWFVVNFNYTKADYLALTPREKAFIYKAYETKTVNQSTLLRDTVLNAISNSKRRRGASVFKLWKKHAKKADISTVRDNMKVIAEIEKNDTGWIDKIYAANGWTRK